jgi:hypothetical protein
MDGLVPPTNRSRELRTLAAYITALGGRMEIVADFGGERLVVG